MFFIILLILLVGLFLLKNSGFYHKYDRRFIEVSFFMSINLLLGVLYNYFSSTDLLFISVLLSLFNGPLLYYLLFDKSKFLFYQLYVMILLVFVYIIGYSFYVDKEESDLITFNCYSALIGGSIGLTYLVSCYYFFVQTSKGIYNEKIVVIFIVIFLIESLLIIPDFRSGVFDINPLLGFVGCSLILVVVSQIYLLNKYLQKQFCITKSNDDLLFLELKNSVVYDLPDIIDVDHEVLVNEVLSINTNVAASDSLVDETELLVISSVLNDVLIDNKLFLDPNLTLQKLSKRTDISRGRLTAYFKSSEASNFSKYINRLRIEYAVIYLHDSNNDDLSIEKWALLSGFNSRVTFYRSFVGIYGFAPSELLKK